MPDINGYWMVKSPGIASEWIYDHTCPSHTCPSQFGVETKASVGFDPSPALWSQPIEGSGPSPHRPPVLLRAVRSELCAALGSWCFADFAEMVFWHSLHYPTRRHHCQEYQRISSQTTNEMLDTFYGSLCSANCIDAHYFSMWNPFSFCPSTCSKQSSCADQEDLAQLFKAASVELLSSSGVSESPRRSTNSLSFEGTEEQGLKRITSICGPSTWPPQKHTMFLFCHRFSVGPDFGPTILGPGHARSSLVLLLRILTICGTALGQLPTQDTPAGVC